MDSRYIENVLEVNQVDMIIKNLRTKSDIKILKDISFNMKKGEVISIVGESGCGKSMTANTIINLLPENGRIDSGSILFNGPEEKIPLEQLERYGKKFRSLRGNNISMIFQDPLTSLNPVYTIGDQILEVVLEHNKINRKEARKNAIELLVSLGIHDAEERFDDYPHQFSGGQRQRIMIAIAMINNPDILIADEPTTALDVTIQGQILKLLLDLREDYNTGTLLITHDLGVVSETADTVIVMYAGEIVEIAPVEEIFNNPKHPYTRSLMRAIPTGEINKKLYVIDGMVPPIEELSDKGCRFAPRIPWIDETAHEEEPELHQIGKNHYVRCKCYKHFHFEEDKEVELEEKIIGEAILRVENVKKYFSPRKKLFSRKGKTIKALDDVSFTVHRGSTVGIVGESGSGKSTIAKSVMGLHDITDGKINIKFGETFRDITKMNYEEEMEFRKKVQMVFQDPYSSLNPSKTIFDSFEEPMIVHGINDENQRFSIMQRVLGMVNLPISFLNRYPHEFSGGQLQRLSIARALCLSPEIIILDEPVSALDLSVQAQVLNYLGEIQRNENLTYMFISHDLSVVRYLCDYIYVIHNGRFVEAGTRDDIFNNAQHIYTQRLLASAPVIDFNSKNERVESRHQINDHYFKNFGTYYDENLRAFDLKQISPTHMVSVL